VLPDSKETPLHNALCLCNCQLVVGKPGRHNTEMIHQPGGHTSDIMVAPSRIQNPPRLSYETSPGWQAWVSIANQVLLTSWILSWSLAKDESPVLVNTKRKCLPSCISFDVVIFTFLALLQLWWLYSRPSPPSIKQICWSLHISYHRWSNAEESGPFTNQLHVHV